MGLCKLTTSSWPFATLHLLRTFELMWSPLNWVGNCEQEELQKCFGIIESISDSYCAFSIELITKKLQEIWRSCFPKIIGEKEIKEKLSMNIKERILHIKIKFECHFYTKGLYSNPITEVGTETYFHSINFSIKSKRSKFSCSEPSHKAQKSIEPL